MEWVSNLSGLPKKDPAVNEWASSGLRPGEKRGGAEGLDVGVMTASKKVPGVSTMGVGGRLAG